MATKKNIEEASTVYKAVLSFYKKKKNTIIVVLLLLDCIFVFLIFSKWPIVQLIEDNQRLQEIEREYDSLVAEHFTLTEELIKLYEQRIQDETKYAKTKHERDSLIQVFHALKPTHVRPVFELSDDQADSIYTNTFIPYLKRRYEPFIENKDSR